MQIKRINVVVLGLMMIAQVGWSQDRTGTRATAHYLRTPFIHPGMMQDRRDLDFMKQQVAAGKSPWKKGFDNLKKRASLSFTPQPYTHVFEGAYGANDHGGGSLQHSASQSYDDALMWYITGNQSYAKKAIEILNAWSRRLWDLEGNNAKLLVGLSGYYFLNAAEILKYTNSGWGPKDITAFKHLMLTVYYPYIRDFFGEANGNWDASMINTMLCIGIFTDNHDIFNRAVERYYRGHGNSGITHYIYPSGQIQETVRDWGHVQLGMGELAKAAQVAWTQGVDFYGVAHSRLALGFEYTAKYMLGGNVPVYGIISPRGRGNYRDRDIYEGIYDHYHNVEGIAMPYTDQVILQHTRPTSSIGVLTGLRAPVASRPAVFKTLSASPPAILRAGAVDFPTAKPAEGAIIVAPGASIQAALDSLHGREGWIVLAKGVHTLQAPLKIPSNITLSGMGNATILFLDPKLKTYTILNADSNMHEVTLRDFLIEGATSTETHSDPNQDRRGRFYMSAPSRGGINFAANDEGRLQHIRMEHVTVQHCTLNGVVVSGATTLLIDSCDFSDNGASVVPGPGLHHNLELLHVDDSRVKDSRLDDSPFGCGVKVIYGKRVIVSGNETARNGASGVSCMASENVQITGNLVEGNDGNGVEVQGLMEDKSSRITVRGTTARNNGKFGILIHPTGSNLSNNKLMDNGLR